MTPTTASVLRGQFRSAIEGITPTYAKHGNYPWRYVKSPEEVPSPRIRTFTLLADIPIADDGDTTVYGGGISYRYTLQVMASYASLPLVEDEQIIEEDARDLWIEFDTTVKNSNSGLMEVSPPTWITDSVSEDGHVFGVFQFGIRYFGRNE